ncbi:MAG: aldehyde dehydrogenase [Planctomycetota bacterium]|nr:aldehyde dehydrogenase [Planctomycetota bacterium]
MNQDTIQIPTPVSQENVARGFDLDASHNGWTLPLRLQWLEGFGARIDRHADDLIELIQIETGKSPWEAFASEILPLRASIHWHLRNAVDVLATRRLSGRPWWMLGQRHHVLRLPVGRVAIIATWNYPVQLLGIQLVQSIVAGNVTLVKPSENSPRSQGLLLRLAAEGLPEGRLTRTAATRAAGEELFESHSIDPSIPFDHIVFTGSTEVGRVIAKRAAESLTPTTLELSGCDSAIVFASAEAKLAAKSLWQAVVLNAGQTCMAPRRIIVESQIYRQFLSYLAPQVAGTKQMRLISQAAARKMDSCVRQSVSLGGHSLSGVVEYSNQANVRPIAIFDCPVGSELALGNHFSPAVAVIRADDEAHALAIHKSFRKHLSVSVFASSQKARSLAGDAHFIDQLRAGSVTFNDSLIPTAHPSASIRGTGESGWGVSRGEAGLLELTRSVTVSNTSRWIRMPTGEPDRKTQRILRSILGGFKWKSKT